MGGIPIISLDKIYLKSDGINIIFLDCTRLDGSKKLVSRINPNDEFSVEIQIENISKQLKDVNRTRIFLADDVVFSGSVLRTIIDLFKQNGIEVIGIRSAITTKQAYDYFNQNLLFGLDSGYLMLDDVIDQICERDFYFGIAQSGISIRNDGIIYKAPYFKPYGNPVERASIPSDEEIIFSNGCIDRSLYLWNEISRLSERSILISDLPEAINLTNSKETVVKTLKKGRL